MSTRAIYCGPRRKLVLAFDVGTTYSGISYSNHSVLDPGQVPEIKGVTRFPAHEHISGASKIPTVIYYDRNGKVRAVGAEAMKRDIYEAAEDEKWVKAERFKLHLRSKVDAGRSVGSELPLLPLNKTVVEVFGDFLRYLLECASSYIQYNYANGHDLWDSVKSHIDFVLSHPNGWEGTQQSEMRRAAVLAGLVSDNASGHARLSFVTEGEATLHFSVQNGLPDGVMKNGDGVVIADAGGGTIDISSYSRNKEEKFEEIAASQCHFHGSVSVTFQARRFLENYLSGSVFLDDLDHIVRCFDKTTNIQFMKAEEAQYVKFGSTRDNDERYNIRFGQLKLMGSDVAKFFQPSIDCIVKAVLEQKTSVHKSISHVVLVGGLAASDWLFTKVYEILALLGLKLVRPENHLNKAVSDGAISFYLDNFVKTRVSEPTFGHIPYDPSAPDHRSRSQVFTVSENKDAQAPSGHLSGDEQQDRILEVKQSTQISGYGQESMDTFMSVPTGAPPPPKDRYQLLEEEYHRTRDELRQARDIHDCELRRRDGELQQANQVIGHLQHETQRFKDSISGLQNELYNIHQQLEDAKNLSEVRRKELFGAQVFLTKADTLSISEVGEKVATLNEGIFQAAATLGDILIHKRHDEVTQAYMDAATAESQEMVGERLTNILITQSQKPEPEVNPLLVQVVLQIFMVQFCVSKIQSWYLDNSAIERFLGAIYSDIRSTQEQAVSGRWRALTRAHTRPTTETWQKELYRKLRSIFLVASWKTQPSQHENPFGQCLPSIFKTVNELRMAIGEKFTSADLDIFVFECDKTYDPETMDDAYSGGRQSSGKRATETIVGTTGIGLGKIIVGRSVKDAQQLQTIIPAKIVLRSTLNEALEFIRPTSIRKIQQFLSRLN